MQRLSMHIPAQPSVELIAPLLLTGFLIGRREFYH